MYLVVKVLAGRGHTLRAAPVGEYPTTTPIFPFRLPSEMMLLL